MDFEGGGLIIGSLGTGSTAGLSAGSMSMATSNEEGMVMVFYRSNSPSRW